MKIDLVILIAMILTALWTVMGRSLLRAAIGLALTSAIVSIMLYQLSAPLAAVFELSVCAGLITVIFITTVSLTQPLTMSEVYDHARRRLSRFWFLPFLVVIVAAIIYMLHLNLNLPLPAPETVTDVRSVLWNVRTIDLVGQLAVLLIGAYGVNILFKEIRKK